MTHYYGVDTVLDPHHINITQSDLTAFKRDRRIWFLKTYLGLRPKKVKAVGPLVLGTLVHAALEQKYKHGNNMHVWFRQHIPVEGAAYAALDPYFQWADWNKQAEQGRLMLEGYDDWIDDGHMDDRYDTWAVEHLLQTQAVYGGETITLSGKADLIVRDRITNELLIFDWKTAANIERTIQQAHTTEQLPYYSSLLRAAEPTENVGGAAFNILLKSKRTERATPPFFHREMVSYDRRALAARQASIDGTIRDYVAVVRQLHEGVPDPLRVAYANPGVQNWDNWLVPLIDVMDTGGNVAGIIRNQYQQADPYTRYSEPESPFLNEE